MNQTFLLNKYIMWTNKTWKNMLLCFYTLHIKQFQQSKPTLNLCLKKKKLVKNKPFVDMKNLHLYSDTDKNFFCSLMFCLQKLNELKCIWQIFQSLFQITLFVVNRSMILHNLSTACLVLVLDDQLQSHFLVSCFR